MKYLMPVAIALLGLVAFLGVAARPAGGMTVEPVRCWDLASPPVTNPDTKQIWVLFANGCTAVPEFKWVRFPVPPDAEV